MKPIRLLLLVATAALLGVMTIGYLMPDEQAAGRPRSGDAAPAGGDFTLTGAAGPVSLADYRGKIVVLYFGYTFCPDACPTSLGALAGALSLLGADEVARVRGIFVSVDPDRDTLEILRDYAPYFHPAIVGVRGTPQQVAAVARQYGVIYMKQKADANGNYAVDHSSYLYVVDAAGKLAHRLPHGASPEEIAAKLRSVLESGKAP